MIVYNNRYKGALEYDKFAFNIFALHNIVKDYIENELKENDSINLIKINSEINVIFEKITGDDQLSETIYKMIEKYKEIEK